MSVMLMSLANLGVYSTDFKTRPLRSKPEMQCACLTPCVNQVNSKYKISGSHSGD